jgi:Mlc titration factor MtfA (ptsG expression regulator)
MLDGETDGVPPLPRDQRERWLAVLEREYESAQRAAAAGRKSFLDSYAATNPAELFAVASESFFERARRMRTEHKELYGLMRDFYRQDPAAD